ncbi:MAG: sigma 54-interacting transcriptional regulator [Deltaproteobacteria bacterium]|nr:sigma 54-interacting transcriptional regulator [Deltaproteobacteria bacterium]
MRKGGSQGAERGAGSPGGGGYRLVALSAEGTLEFDLPPRGEFTVGRTPAAFVALEDASVSRTHAVLLLDVGRALIADRRCRNGTFVNGTAVPAAGRTVLPGDEVRFGAVCATLVERARPGAPAPKVAAEVLDLRLAAAAERAVRNERPLAALCVAPISVDEASLQAVAEVTASCLRTYDLVAERDGSRLEVLLPECTQDGALRIAQRMDAALRQSKLAARIGVAAFPATSPSVESLLPSADVARRAVTHAGVGVAHGATRVLHAGGRAVVATHPAMLQVFALVERLAHGVGPVLVMGERGAGTTTVADALHALGPRADRPLVHLDCAATPAAQLAAELLGVQGHGDPGAGTATTGVLEFASGGTVVLQEIGHLSLELQATLLRVLQTKSCCRLGAATAGPVDVRLVATSSKDLALLRSEGTFRRDLQILLSETSVALLPLRARRREVPLLARWFVEEAMQESGRQAPTLSPGVETALRRYTWPGNLDELRRVVAGAVAECQGEEIQVSHLPVEIAGSWSGADDGSGWDARSFDETSVVTLTPTPTAARRAAERPVEPAAAPPSDGIVMPADRPYDEALETVQRLLVERALAQADGALPKAAALLGMDKRRLTRLLDKLGVEH